MQKSPWSLILFLAVYGCGPSARSGRGGAPDDMSGAMAGADAGPSGATCSDIAKPCPMNERCIMGQCVLDNGNCQSDDQCQSDTYCNCTAGGGDDGGAPCLGGVCVPWGTPPRGTTDPNCQGASFEATDFKPPVVHCQWSDTGVRGWVLMTPLVVDINGDNKPEILFSPMSRTNGVLGQRIVALRSSDCSVIYDKDVNLQPYTQLAVADLDGDKIPEIVGILSNKTLAVFDNQSTLLATSPTPYSYSVGAEGDDATGPAIANIDGKGGPEIAVAGQVMRYVKGQKALTVLWSKPVMAATWGTLDALADLDGDGVAEVVVGRQVFDGMTGADKTPSSLKALAGPAAYPAIGDFNADKKPDLVVVQSQDGAQQVSVIDFANDKVIFGPYTVQGGGWGGPPTVADFDGDGVPDFGLSSSTHYYVYSMKCAANVKPKDCTGTDPGVLWEKETHDVTSGGTASSVFDFNGDGKAEVVYRDECWLRVYNGPDGKTVFAANITSGTALENPVIADIDGDGHADIVVTSDDIQKNLCPAVPEAETHAPFTGTTKGLYTFRDPMNRWMPSRGIWNEHSYHITNINDDLTVPVMETPNWLTWNDYRQNVQGVPGKPAPQGDVTSGVATGIDSMASDCMNAWTLHANLCNRGTAPLPAGINGTFYSSDPRKANPVLLCTTHSSAPLLPGKCETVQCDWKSPPKDPVDLWFRGNDDGTGAPGVPECKQMNDILFIHNAQCTKIG